MNGSGYTINVAGTSPDSAHTVTVPHTHQSFVERCYQCDLIQRNAELRAENNAWQEAMLDLTERYGQSQVEVERLTYENRALHGDVMDSDHNELVQLREEVAYLRKYTRHRPDGQRQPGERNGQHKLTTASVRLIRSMLADGIQQKVIAQRFGVHKKTIWDIKTGKHWGTVL